jgi:Fic family protein
MRIARPPETGPILEKLLHERPGSVMQAALTPEAADAEYVHWDDFRHRPSGDLTPAEAWALLAASRVRLRRAVGLRARTAQGLVLAEPTAVLRSVHGIDVALAGRMGILSSPPTDLDRQELVLDALIDEAFRSSTIEGAVTTRREAERLVRTGATPRTRSQRMVLNNYRAMERIRDWVARRRAVSVDALIELQAILVDEIAEADVVGRLRRDSDRVVVATEADGEIVHTPPPETRLPGLLDELEAFANAGTDANPFIHPLLRAILCHYQLAWIHPFVDGNGRAARALWYWVMLQQGYAMTEFLSLSHAIARARPAYYRSFLHVQTDSDDATYFVIHQLQMIEAAIADVARTLRRHEAARASAADALRGLNLNERQRRVVEAALRAPSTPTSVRSHAEYFDVVLATARTDLVGLVDAGLLEMSREGRKQVFWPVADLVARVRAVRR